MAGVISIGELRGVITLSDQFSGPINKVASALGITSASFAAVTQAAAIGAAAIGAATAAVVALGIRGADVADVSAAFDDLSEAAGSTADIMLGELQKGTLGTITNFDLMKLANKALGAGLIKTADDMGTLAQGAQLLADRTGGDTKEAFETLTGAIASGRTAQLKQLGLFVDSKVAIQDYAASLHKSVSDLSDSERAQALSAGTLKLLREQLAANGPATADFGDNVKRAKVAFTNFTDQLGVGIATSPVIQAGMTAVGKALQGAFGGSQQDMIKTIMEWVNKFAIGLTYVGQIGVVAATVLTTAFYAIKTVVLAVIEVVLAVGTAIVGLVTGIAILGTKIPGLGKHIEGFAEGARGLTKAMDETTRGIAAQTVEAAKGVIGNSDAQRSLDALGGSILNVRADMEAQVGAAALVTKTHREMGAAATEAASRSVEASAKIRDAFTTLQHDISLANTEGAANRLMSLEFEMEKQIQAARDLKGITLEEYQLMVDGIGELFDRRAEKALDSSTEILAAETKLQEDLALANTAGLEGRALSQAAALEVQLLEQDIARQHEIEGIEALELKYGETFTELRALVSEKYAGMAESARGATAQMTADAQAAFSSSNAAAVAAFDSIMSKGDFTYAGLQAAHAAYKKAEDDLNEKSALSTMQKFELLASSASSILRSLFGKSKAAAIAAAIIDTAAAVVKSLAAYPWPFNLVAGAAAFAAGMAQVNKIRSTDAGFKQGTPGTMFQDFGRESMVPLHGREAVVTPAQGAGVASMVGDAIRDARRERSGGSGRFGVAIQIGPQSIRDWRARELRAGFAPA